MKLNQTLIMNTQGNKLLLDKDGYLIREDFQGKRQAYSLEGSGAASSEITEIEIVNSDTSTIEINANSLEELKKTYLFGPLSNSSLTFPLFPNLAQTSENACEKTIEIWLQNTATISTIDFGTSEVINSDSIPSEFENGLTHVFTVRINYVPNFSVAANVFSKKIVINYAYSFANV